MVLIFSDPKDSSTDLVLDWLLAQSTPFLRVNSNQLIELINFRIDPHLDISFTIDGDSTRWSTQQFDSVWYRRELPQIKITWQTEFQNNSPITSNLRQLHFAEEVVMKQLFEYALSKIPSLGSPWALPENKLKDLDLFRACGGLVPITLVTGNKKELLAFSEQCSNPLIFKKINYSFTHEANNGIFMQYTEALTLDIIASLPDTFDLTCFQEQIPKLFEIRVFVLNSALYSMAIWSQKDAQTAMDFRRYNSNHPNRFVPFELPAEVQRTIHAFMQASRLNTGSIDMIHTTSGDYFFLEINPIGQFGMVSQACNYNFEKHIAHELQRIRHNA